METYAGFYILKCGDFSSDYIIDSSFKLTSAIIDAGDNVIHSNENLKMRFNDGNEQKNIFYLGRTALGEPIVLEGQRKYLLTSDSRLPKDHPVHCFDLPLLLYKQAAVCFA